MSKYFEEVEFVMPVNPGEPVRPPTISYSAEKVKAAAELIGEEFEKIKGGTSEFTTYPVNPGSFGFPAANRLTMFIADPTDDNRKAFIEIAKQDFGVRAAAHFADLLKDTREVTNV